MFFGNSWTAVYADLSISITVNARSVKSEKYWNETFEDGKRSVNKLYSSSLLRNKLLRIL